MSDFFTALFNVGESTCFAPDPYGVTVHPIRFGTEKQFDEFGPFKQPNYFSINPISQNQTRKDEHVTAFRNILIEMDKIPLTDQIKRVEEIGLPFTTCVYSGGKSYHYVISLSEPYGNEVTWRAVVQRVFDVVGRRIVDSANGNPSRLSRCPGSWRADTSRFQDCLHIGQRIDKQRLEEWLQSHGSHFKKRREPIPETVQLPKYITDLQPNYLNPWTQRFIMFGAEEGERNRSLFSAACDFAKCKKSIEEAYQKLIEPSGLRETEAKSCIRSAYSRVEKDKNKQPIIGGE